MSTSLFLSERLLISSPDEVDSLATDLASDYISYFDIDISSQQERHQDSIEECLAHLEEVISALDSYKQNSEAIDDFVDTILRKDQFFEQLFGHVDSAEQYVFETSRVFDQMEDALKDLEQHQSSKDGRIKQLLNMIPGVSSLPRFGLFSTIGGLVDSTANDDFVETLSDATDDQQMIPISDILDRLKHIEATQSTITTNLENRIYGVKAHLSTEVHEPMANLTLESSETQEDGSWQELL